MDLLIQKLIYDFVYGRTNSSSAPSSVHPSGLVHPLNFFPFPMSASLYTTTWSLSPKSTLVGPSDSAYYKRVLSEILFSTSYPFCI